MADTIIMDDMSMHCTLIRRKGNKPLAGRTFELGICTKDEALLRIKAHFISEGLFWELDEETFVYFMKLSQGNVTESKKFSGFIEQFDRLFRCII